MTEAFREPDPSSPPPPSDVVAPAAGAVLGAGPEAVVPVEGDRDARAGFGGDAPDPPAGHRRLAGEEASPTPGVQLVVLFWCLWLLASWASGRWQSVPGDLGQWMMLASIIGLLALWPAMRLSQLRQPPGRLSHRCGPGAASLRRRWRLSELGVEWLCLILVFQAVVWPLSFVGGWGLARTLWLDAAVIAWSAMAAALVGFGSLTPSRLARTAAATACVLLLLAEPLVMGVAAVVSGGALNWTMGVTPLPTLWTLSEPGPGSPLEPSRSHVLGMATAAAAGWVMLAVLARRATRPAEATKTEAV
ncbi:MAG: hypothetical protein WD118_05250 [Phycisphaeraceae bacterium]